MSKKANPTLVGGFVLGALALAVVGVLVFGAGSLFVPRFDCILYFEESIDGLDVGAPVDFQGVRIGTVSDVRLVVDRAGRGRVFRPVTVQIEENRVSYAGDSRMGGKLSQALESLVRREGLRARLAWQSVLTGKLKIELGYFPQTAIRRLGRDEQLWEMPTVASALHKVARQVEELPLKDIVFEAHRAMKAIADLLASDETTQLAGRINEALVSLHETLVLIQSRAPPLADASEKSLADLSDTLRTLQSMADSLDARIDPLVANLSEASADASRLLDPASPMQQELLRAVDALTTAARSLHSLTEYLERHPESLLRGKP